MPYVFLQYLKLLQVLIRDVLCAIFVVLVANNGCLQHMARGSVSVYTSHPPQVHIFIVVEHHVHHLLRTIASDKHVTEMYVEAVIMFEAFSETAGAVVNDHRLSTNTITPSHLIKVAQIGRAHV